MAGENQDLAQVSVKPIFGGARVTITGEIDFSNAINVAHRIRRVGPEHPSTIVVDLSAVTFLDSQGVAELHRLHVEFTSTGRVLYVRTGRDTVAERVVRLTNLDAIWNLLHSDAAPPA